MKDIGLRLGWGSSLLLSQLTFSSVESLQYMKAGDEAVAATVCFIYYTEGRIYSFQVGAEWKKRAPEFSDALA